jgi:topoisomerase-4 subunit A
VIYRDGKSGPSYIKRFNVSAVTRDKLYDLANGTKGSQILYFTCNPMEAETIILRQIGSIKKLKFDIDFAKWLLKVVVQREFSF